MLSSLLGKRAGRSPATVEDIREMAQRAWRQRGLALIDPADVTDPFARQAIINEAERLYGERCEERKLERT